MRKKIKRRSSVKRRRGKFTRRKLLRHKARRRRRIQRWRKRGIRRINRNEDQTKPVFRPEEYNKAFDLAYNEGFNAGYAKGLQQEEEGQQQAV